MLTVRLAATFDEALWLHCLLRFFKANLWGEAFRLHEFFRGHNEPLTFQMTQNWIAPHTVWT